jgi:hypothetical protein
MAQSEQARSDISGSYLATTGAFASGITDPTAYARTLAHLRTVLAAAHPGGNPYWGRAGIEVSRWVHEGRAVLASRRAFTTAAEFEACVRGAAAAATGPG